MPTTERARKLARCDRATASRTIALLLVTTLQLACATIQLGEPRISDEPLNTVLKEEPSTKILGAVTQQGTSATVTAQLLCDSFQLSEVKRTTVRDRELASVTKPALFTVFGLVAVGAGVGIIVDAQLNVHPEDTASHQYNRFGPDLATAAGVGVAALGCGLLTVAVVDAVRASGAETTIERVSLEPKPMERSIKCGTRSPAAGMQVTAKSLSRGVAIPLGALDSNGELLVHLADDIPDSVTIDDGVLTLSVYVEGRVIGKLRLADAHAIHEERRAAADDAAWTAVDAEPCSSDADAVACESVARYKREHPKGRHVKEANRTLRAARALEQQREEEALASEQAEREKREAAERRAAAAARARRARTPRPPPTRRSSGMLRCCDGTLSPTCSCSRASRRGCCSHHGGICGCD